MSTISAGNTISTSITITGDTSGNLVFTPFTGKNVILTGPLQYADGTTANTAASAVAGAINVTLQQSYGGF
jgi:hypothetical protein